jgi:hypothetical protein
MSSVLPRILASMARQAIESFDLATELDHPGEGGRAREEAIRRFLVGIVPPDFGIDTGFVIDAVGGVSRQVDVVIFRRQRAPVLEIGGVKHFMVESVAAVVEIKAVVKAKKVLTSALDNIGSVKDLDRTNEGRNRLVGAGAPVDPTLFQHQIWGAIVAGRSMKYSTCLNVLLDWMEPRPRRLWPNAYVDIHEFLIDYAYGIGDVGPPTRRSSDPTAAQGLGGSAPWKHPWGLEPTLVYLGVELLNFLRVTPRVDFQPYGYFHSTSLPMPSYFQFPADFGSEC